MCYRLAIPTGIAPSGDIIYAISRTHKCLRRGHRQPANCIVVTRLIDIDLSPDACCFAPHAHRRSCHSGTPSRLAQKALANVARLEHKKKKEKEAAILRHCCVWERERMWRSHHSLPVLPP